MKPTTEFITEVISTYRENIRSFILLILPSIAIQLSLQILLTSGLFPRLTLGGPIFYAYIFLTILSSFLSLLASVATIYLMHDKKMKPIAAIGKSFKKIPALLWGMLLFACSYMGSGMLLFFPAIIMIVYSSLYLFPLLLENRSGIGAMAASWYYIRGKWWRVLGRFVLFYILLFFFMIILLMASVVAKSTPFFVFVQSFISSIVSVWLGQMVMVGMYVMYKDLRNRKGDAPDAMGKRGIFLRITAIIGSVLIILGIAAMALLIAVNPGQQISKARQFNKIYTMQTTQKALKLYYDEKGSYPKTLTELIPDFMASPSGSIGSFITYEQKNGDFILCSIKETENETTYCMNSKTPIPTPTDSE